MIALIPDTAAVVHHFPFHSEFFAAATQEPFCTNVMAYTEYDDLFQEGLIGLLKAVRSYDGKSSSFATFASHCIRNSIISGVRKFNSQTKNTTIDNSDSIPEDTVPSAEDITVDAIRAKLLYKTVSDALSDYERMIFEMYLSDLSYESIAFVTGRDIKSVQNAVYRIRTKLKSIVKTADNAGD